MSATNQPPTLDKDQRRVLNALLAMQRQSWEQGVASHALLDLEQHTLVEVMARDSVTRQTSDGRLADLSDSGIVNCGSAGEAVLWAARRTREPHLLDAFDRQLRWLLRDAPRAPDGALFHIARARECWVDTVYMVVPFLVVAGHVEEAEQQLMAHRERLFNSEAGLYAWRWDEDTARVTHPEHWGTGNGWVVAAIARTLRLLEGVYPEFAASAATHARTVLDACLTYRNPDDGLFHNVVDDTSTFGEANLAQMLAYGALTGVADGWLPATYADVGRSLLESARRKLDGYGFVTGVCGSPRFDRQGTSVEAQSFFLLASAAEQRLLAR
jgi:unsaturated rhamnogalacturonyl hydrolase